MSTDPAPTVEPTPCHRCGGMPTLERTTTMFRIGCLACKYGLGGEVTANGKATEAMILNAIVGAWNELNRPNGMPSELMKLPSIN